MQENPVRFNKLQGMQFSNFFFSTFKLAQIASVPNARNGTYRQNWSTSVRS